MAYEGRRVAEPYAKARWDKMIQYVREILPK